MQRNHFKNQFKNDQIHGFKVIRRPGKVEEATFLAWQGGEKQ